MPYFICVCDKPTLQLMPVRMDDNLGTFEIDALHVIDVRSTAEWLASSILTRISALTAGQLLDTFGFHDIELQVRHFDALDTEIPRSEALEQTTLFFSYVVKPVSFRNGILKAPYRPKNGLTVLQLKRLAANWPEFNDDGEPTEVWIGSIDDTRSRIAKEVISLNDRLTNADMLIWF